MKVLLAIVGFFIVYIIVFNLSRTTQPVNPERERKFQLAVAGAMTLRDSMRNPESFVVESAFVVDGTDTLCYEYRAQNGFGGMNREMAVISIKSNKVVNGRSNKVFALWNKECANKPSESIDTVNTALRLVRK